MQSIARFTFGLASLVSAQELPFKVLDSKSCRLSCIDQGNTYCPTSVRVGDCDTF